MFRKKNAFTLAEILVTVGILGLLAAITLPSINSNVNESQYVSALRFISSSLSDKIQAQMAIEDVYDVRDLKAFADITTNNTAQKTKLLGKFGKFLAFMPTADDHTGLVLLNGKTPSNGDGMPETWKKEEMRLTNNGALLYLHDIEEARASNGVEIKKAGGAIYRRAAIVYIDINAYKKPNRVGYDIYKFYLGQDGRLYPVGGLDVSMFDSNGTSETSHSWQGSSADYKCNKAYKGFGCAGRIEDEGWKIRYTKEAAEEIDDQPV